MLKSIEKMLKYFNHYDIQYCHWKSNEHIDDALEGDTDLDILFLSNQRNLIEKVLAEVGLKRFRATPLMQYNAIEDYICLDEDTAKIWHLHLHYKLSLGEKHLKSYTLSWGKDIINRKKLYKNTIYYSDSPDEYLLLLIRIALKLRWRDINKSLSIDDITEIEWLRTKTTNEEVIKTAEHYLSNEVTMELYRILNSDLVNYNIFFKLQSILRKDLINFTGYTRKSSFFIRTKREFFWICGGVKRHLNINSVNPSRRVCPNGGTVITFLGCDGAGKSTTLTNIKNEFNKKIDVYCEYLGSGDGKCSLIRKPMKFIAQKVGGKGLGASIDNNTDVEHKKTFKSYIYNICKIIWAVTLAFEKRKKYKKIIKARNNGMLVLVDRYPQIEFPSFSDGPLLSKYINNKGLLQRISRWEFNIYKSFYKNPPDLLVKLIVPTELAIQRKPEMTAIEIKNKTQAIQSMNFNTNEKIIDTSKELLETKKEVMSSIWEYI